MRILIILTIGTIFTFQSCKKDPIVGNRVCDSENKPAITDSKVNNNFKDITGKWRLINTANFGNQSFLKSSLLNQANKSDERDSLILSFQHPNNKVFASGWGNDCRGSYRLSMQDGKNWMYISDFGCTLLPGSVQYAIWEEKYFKALNNATCYNFRKNRLTVQYHINDSKKGKLINQAIK
jgi:hypothetical protein